MNYFAIGFSALFLITLILYTVFYFKKFTVATKVFECLHSPLLLGLTLSFLIGLLPDTSHIISLLSLALLFLITGQIISQFSKEKFKIVTQLAYIAGLIAANDLVGSIILLYHIPGWSIILGIIIFLLTFIALCILIGKQKILFYVTFFFPVLLTTLFVFTSIITLIAYVNLNSLLLLLSSIVLYLFIIFSVLDYTKFKIKIGKFINHCWLLLVQILFCASYILIIL